MPNNKIDSIDLRILRELQQSGKLSNVDLAGRVGLSPSPCLSRVRSLEQRGIIDRYVALVRPSSVGLLINVFIQITLERQVERALESFEAQMQRYPEVMECYLMTGNKLNSVIRWFTFSTLTMLARTIISFIKRTFRSTP